MQDLGGCRLVRVFPARQQRSASIFVPNLRVLKSTSGQRMTNPSEPLAFGDAVRVFEILGQVSRSLHAAWSPPKVQTLWSNCCVASCPADSLWRNAPDLLDNIEENLATNPKVICVHKLYKGGHRIQKCRARPRKGELLEKHLVVYHGFFSGG